MSLRKALLAASMTLAAMAVAAPAPALADVFTHEGVPIGEQGQVETEFSGSLKLVFLFEAPTEGMHCKDVHLEVSLEAVGTGSVSGFEAADCTSTSMNPSSNGLPMDVIPVNIGAWMLDADAANHEIRITNSHLRFKVTDPFTKHQVQAEWTLKGTLVAKVSAGETEAIETVSLSDDGAILEIPPGSPGWSPHVLGHLTSNGTIGIAA